MSFSEFYQRSINEPEQFWAEQAGVLTGRRPLRNARPQQSAVCPLVL